MSINLPRCPLNIDSPSTEWRAWLLKLDKMERDEVVRRISQYLSEGRYDKWVIIMSFACCLEERNTFT